MDEIFLTLTAQHRHHLSVHVDLTAVRALVVQVTAFEDEARPVAAREIAQHRRLRPHSSLGVNLRPGLR